MRRCGPAEGSLKIPTAVVTVEGPVELVARIGALLSAAGLDAIVVASAEPCEITPTGTSHPEMVGDLVIDRAAHVARRAGAALTLTATEFRLLATFVTNTGIVLSKRRLLELVWGFDDYDVNLVEVHVSALRRKLEAHGGRIVHTVRGVGYVLRPIP